MDQVSEVQRRDPDSADRRRRWMVLLATAVVTAIAGGVWWMSRSRPYVPAANGPAVSTFAVPTYAWDGGSGMDAAVSGTLWFTPEGCTLLGNGEGDQQTAQAVIFPNATGVTYDNGVRAVVNADGDVYAVEGQPFSYAGGYGVTPETDTGRRWLEQCPTANLREGALVNDHPATPELARAPEAPSGAGPTAPTPDKELGFFTVPTFTWDPADGGKDGTATGTLTLTSTGCPVLLDRAGSTIGLVFPNAEAFDDPNTPDGPSIYSSFPNGTSGMMATDGERLSLQGEAAEPTDPVWASPCSAADVDTVFYVHDAPFPIH
jgi:hypothetical protein